jgi:hypothetical protein
MPAAKPKTKPATKVSIKAKREAIAKALGMIPDAGQEDFLYRRRHLATVRDGKRRDLKYIIEVDGLERVISATLDRIHERDGGKVFKEAADILLSSIAVQMEVKAGRSNIPKVSGFARRRRRHRL